MFRFSTRGCVLGDSWDSVEEVRLESSTRARERCSSA